MGALGLTLGERTAGLSIRGTEVQVIKVSPMKWSGGQLKCPGTKAFIAGGVLAGREWLGREG